MKDYQLNYYFSYLHDFPYKEIWEQATYPWEALANVTKFVDHLVVEPNKKENLAHTGEFVSITGNYIIGENTEIGANVCIEGPVIIGRNCTIRPGALIRPYSVIGDNCVVGHGCEVKHSIVQNKAKVQSLTFIGNSIIGKSTRIGSGTILGNRRFDQANIMVKTEHGKIDTGMDFFGAIIGDETRLGANCTTTPGTFIGPHTWILPATSVRGFIPKETKILPVQNTIVQENEMIELN